MNKWRVYEQEKRRLQLKCKTSEEYELAIQKLVKKLKI